MSTFRICSIGCGGMATAGHGPAFARYAASHAGTELASCCDLDEGRARRFAASFGFARAYTDAREMLRAERPDAVALIVPVQFTAAYAAALLEAGFPVIMEKPPGLNEREVSRIIEAAERSGTPHMVSFNRRHMPLVRAFRDMERGEAPRFLQYDFYRVGRTDPDFSTTAVHGIDTTRFLAGADYREVRLSYAPQPGFPAHVRNIFLDCTFASGASARISFCPVSGLLAERCTAHLDGAAIEGRFPVFRSFDLPGRVVRIDGGKLTEIRADDPADGAYFANGFYGENAAFFDAVREGRRPADTAQSGYQTVVIADAIRKNLERVTFPE